MNDSIIELSRLITVMDEDAENLTPTQAISDYIAPILESMLAEIEANRQYVLQAADRANLAMLVNERTFVGEILTSIAEHFSTVIQELPEDTEDDSKLGVAVLEIQDLLATWMSFDLSDEDVNEPSEFEDDAAADSAELEDLDTSTSEAAQASEPILSAEDSDAVIDIEVITDAES